MKYDFENKNPFWKSEESKAPGQIEINGKKVQTYPDNDGGYWYYENGRAVYVHE